MESEIYDPIRYDQWIEDALRDVIRKTLAYTAEHGLSGDHHFYITFRTVSDQVRIPAHMLRQHPEEMTIVLQHQFGNLDVSDNHFSVSLRFSGKMENLFIPFCEVTGFSDPSVNFGLQLKSVELSDSDLEELNLPNNTADKEQDMSPPSVADNNDDKAASRKTGEVVALDAFRKK
jgi:hypothetical protein